jgi:aldehyde dehydrogenase (NAD+)
MLEIPARPAPPFAVSSLIAGEPAVAGGAFVTSFDPWNGIPVAGGAGVDAATIGRALDIAAATAAGYADLGWVARGGTLARAAQIVRERADELADLAVREVGKAISEARGEVERTAVILDFYAGAATQAKGALIPSAEDGVALLTRRRAIGPTAVITPWNFPLAIPAWKIAPALLCGNPVLWKPASAAIGCAHALARCLLDAGVPGGALSLLLGSGAAVAPLLDGPIEAVSFTGSTAVGHAIRARVASRGVKVQLELGGKNVAIVLDDADLDCAAQIAHAAYAFAGQKCTATSVVLATPGVRDELAERLATATRHAPWGDPARDDVWGAPVIDARKAAEIRQTIADARAAGAEVLAEGPDPGRDAVVPPTLVAARSRDLAIAREEVFGPVLAILDAVTPDALAGVANDTPYGLVASVYGRDIDAIRALTNRLDVGMVAINRASTGLEVQAPAGGWKDSGCGDAEQGQEAIRFYTRSQTLFWKSTTPAGQFP